MSTDDVRHLRNRVEEFNFAQVVTSLKDVDSCAPCMARWAIQYADEAATGSIPAPPPAPDAHGTASLPVGGFLDIMAASKLSGPIADALRDDIAATGAVHVSELTLLDWKGLPSWSKLRVMEARRLSSAIAPTGTLGA